MVRAVVYYSRGILHTAPYCYANIVCLSVCLSVCNVQIAWSYRLGNFETINHAESWLFGASRAPTLAI